VFVTRSLVVAKKGWHRRNTFDEVEAGLRMLDKGDAVERAEWARRL
jgi:hypothetical protein